MRVNGHSAHDARQEMGKIALSTNKNAIRRESLIENHGDEVTAFSLCRERTVFYDGTL